MALREVCDVFGTTKGIERYRVLVYKVPLEEVDAKPSLLTEDAFAYTNAVLCPRAIVRLLDKIRSGTLPPMKRDRADAEPPTAPQEPAEATKA